MKRWLLLASCLMLAACEPQARQQAQETPPPPSGPQAPIWEPERITVDELKALMASKDPPYLVDVRRADAYAKSHIKGAISMPGPDHFAVLNGLKKDHLMVLYCT